MIRIRHGVVCRITGQRPDITETVVNIDGLEEKALNYDRLTGPVRLGDQVVLNTTAVHKKLGTGGTHFIMANLANEVLDLSGAGHIMKLRYSPAQVKVLAVEEPDSPYAEAMGNIHSLAGTPVIIGTLHSMLAPAAAAIGRIGAGRLKVAYLMTDGAALPLALSKLVWELKEKGLIHTTITCGHAFGGDLEAITAYTGLLAAKAVAGADIIIACMGPGIVGSASEYGFTGVEQGELVNAVNLLGGRPVAIPRISFADARERHRGLSHHTRTALGKIALTPATVTIPQLQPEQAALIRDQLVASGIAAKHKLVEVDAEPALAALDQFAVKVTTMGRGVNQDREFFLAAGAAGIYAARLAAGFNASGQ